jgi:hypothetical protein
VAIDPRWSAVACSGVLAAAACGEPCGDLPPAPVTSSERFEFLDAWFTDSTHVELAFSLPLDPVDGVDPGKFRLSIAKADRYESRSGCYADTYYCDLSDGLADGGCGRCAEGYYVSDDPQCAPPTVVTSMVAVVDAPNRIRLAIEPPLRDIVCEQAEYVENDGGILLHFSTFDVPTITATDGRELAGFGQRFVLEPDETRRGGVFPDRDTLVRVRCPEDT